MSTVVLTSKFDRALTFARIIHGSDVRKGTDIPYLSHLLQVAGIALEFGGSETEAIGALLHDAAEDGGGERTLDQILSEFGPEVAQIVRENSDSITPTKSEKAPWQERKVRYIEAISHKSRSACLVSIADKLHNVRSLMADQERFGDEHWGRFNATKVQSQWYYGSLVDAFAKRLGEFPELTPAVNELRVAVRALQKS